MDAPPREAGLFPVYQPEANTTAPPPMPPGAQHRDTVEEDLSNHPEEDVTPPPAHPPAPAQPTDAIWTTDEEMEPPTPPPGPAGHDVPAAMENTPPEENSDTMCALWMTAIPPPT